VLRILGEQEGGTPRLEDAVAAFRAALKELTRDRVPLQWAGAQNNLGSALEKLGERESGTGRLKEAVAAYRAANSGCSTMLLACVMTPGHKTFPSGTLTRSKR
jgi:hypothetical protein